MKADLLFEIGVEEIPATAVLPAIGQMRQLLSNAFERARLAYGEIHAYGTPRRLTVLVEELATRQADAIKEYKGPPAAEAFDADGNPTSAAVGFARARGVEARALEVRETDRGAFVFASVIEAGRPAIEVLPDILVQVVSSLTFPKTMRWGSGDFRFCRPVRWVVALLGHDVIPVEVAGIRADAFTRGHRIFGAARVPLSSPTDYLPRLRDNCVIADHVQRRQLICDLVRDAAAQFGGRPRLHPGLLDEVTFLVEYPTPVVGAFDPRFLHLPEAVVVKVLEGHQRFFAVEDSTGQLLPYFVGVRDGTDEGLENVRRGYERVVRPRLEDAEFYLHEDLKIPFAQRTEHLKRVVFIAGAGTLYDKTQRLVGLVNWLGKQIGAPEEVQDWACRAAQLCKCDQTTMMIGDTKLGELQGFIGGEYARRAGEAEPVAQAIAEHYRPKSAEDMLPETMPGQLLATADRLDNLVSCYALGLRPSGSQDPYALRRQMQGLIAIAVSANLRYPVEDAIWHAYRLLLTTGADPSVREGRSLSSEAEESFRAAFRQGVQGAGESAGTQPQDRDQVGADLEQPGYTAPREASVALALGQLAAQRLAVALEDEGVRYDLPRAVNSAGWRDFVEAWHRAKLLQAKADTDPEWEHVVLTGQRISNIYRPAQDQAAETCQETLLVESAEKELWWVTEKAHSRVSAAIAAGRWEELWDVAVGLAPYVDKLFDEVLVMTEDLTLRANRLALLREVQSVLLYLSDFRQIVLE